jgi:hypothetical protein
MVWSKYNCSSTSVGKKINEFVLINYLFRRIASNEFDKQVNVHVAMDNTLILDEIRRFYLLKNTIENSDFVSFKVNYGKLIPKFVKQQKNRMKHKMDGNH